MQPAENPVSDLQKDCKIRSRNKLLRIAVISKLWHYEAPIWRPSGVCRACSTAWRC